MPEHPQRWVLEDFVDALDRWIAVESPADDVRLATTTWIFTRADDPYQGVRREPSFPNLWFGAVPGTVVGSTTVACSYWIEEQRRAVRCDSFATLSLPL